MRLIGSDQRVVLEMQRNKHLKKELKLQPYSDLTYHGRSMRAHRMYLTYLVFRWGSIIEWDLEMGVKFSKK